MDAITADYHGAEIELTDAEAERAAGLLIAAQAEHWAAQMEKVP